MKRMVDVITVLLCCLTAVCTLLLKIDNISSFDDDAVDGMASKPVVVVKKKLESISNKRPTKMLYLATAAAVSASLLRIFSQIRLERAISSLTKNRP